MGSHRRLGHRQRADPGSAPATLTLNGTATSAGTITLTHTGTNPGGITSLIVGGGHTLTSTGSIVVNGTGGSQVLEGAIVNAGSFTQTSTSLQFEHTGSSFANQGSFSVASGASFGVDATTAFTNGTGGSITNKGTFKSAGSLTQGNGTESTNPIEVEGGSIDFNGTGSPAAYTVEPGDTSATAEGSIPAGVDLTVNGADPGASPATLTLNGTTTSAGTITLTHTGTNPNGVSSLVVGTGHTLTSSGSIVVNGTGGNQALEGAIVNDGTFTQTSTALQLEAKGSSFVNDGSLSVASGTSFGVDATTTFTNGDGHASGVVSLKNTGTFSDAGTFDEGSGTISGNDPTVTGSLNYEAGAGAGAIEAPPNSTVSLSGNISSGQTLLISGLDACSGRYAAKVSTAGSFSNAGTIDLRYTGTCTGGTPTLTLPSGDTLTNTGNVLVEGVTKTTTTTVLNGSLTNEGTVNVENGTLVYGSTGATWDNKGSLEIQAGTVPGTVSIGAKAAFTNGTGGSITNKGTFKSAGSLTQGNGTESTNPIEVEGGSIDFNGTGSPAAYTVQPGDTSATAEGSIPAGVDLTVNGADPGASPATLTLNGTTTSAGTITLTHTGTNPNGVSSLVVGTGHTLTSSGSIVVNGTGQPGPRRRHRQRRDLHSDEHGAPVGGEGVLVPERRIALGGFGGELRGRRHHHLHQR